MTEPQMDRPMDRPTETPPHAEPETERAPMPPLVREQLDDIRAGVHVLRRPKPPVLQAQLDDIAAGVLPPSATIPGRPGR
jgi:hypothetical protein